MAAPIPSFTLNDGTKMPSIGMGCLVGHEEALQDRTVRMCTLALKHGYRHFDTAYGYGNEAHVGKAIRESGIPRNEIYITSKLPNEHHHRVRESFQETFDALDCEYLDLYLIHWPHASIDGNVLSPEEHPTVLDTWKEMEKLLGTGKVKSIGVSNFSIKTLNQILPHCSVVPAVNQVELHPYLPQHELKAFCDEKGILITGYSPLGRGPALLENNTLAAVAKEANATIAQVLISWGVQRGIAMVPKSENEDRMKANIALIKLSEEQLKVLNELHKQPGLHRSVLNYHQQYGKHDVFGWTYEQMGWNMTTGGVILD